MNIKKSIDELCDRACKSRLDVGDYDIRQKNAMLNNLCQLIKQNESKIISFNKKDLVIAKRKQLSDSFIDRINTFSRIHIWSAPKSCNFTKIVVQRHRCVC